MIVEKINAQWCKVKEANEEEVEKKLMSSRLKIALKVVLG